MRSENGPQTHHVKAESGRPRAVFETVRRQIVSRPRKRLGRRRPVLEEIREKEHRVRNSARVPVAVAVARRQTSGHRGATEIVEEQGHHVSDIHWPDAVAVTVAALE